MLALVIVTMAIIWLAPKVTKAIPAPLLAIVAVSLLVIGVLTWISRGVGDMAQIAGGLPQFPHSNGSDQHGKPLQIIVSLMPPFSQQLALIESLLTLKSRFRNDRHPTAAHPRNALLREQPTL